MTRAYCFDIHVQCRVFGLQLLGELFVGLLQALNVHLQRLGPLFGKPQICVQRIALNHQH